MTGVHRTHIQRSGQMCLNVTAVLIAISLLLSGCAVMDPSWWVGDGRGDWSIDLFAGYNIVKVNSREVLLCHRDDPTVPGAEIVIPNYFITVYQAQEPYILLEGIRTQKLKISEEEKKDYKLSYYLVDSTDGEIAGPFESLSEFQAYCTLISLEIQEEWEEAGKRYLPTRFADPS